MKKRASLILAASVFAALCVVAGVAVFASGTHEGSLNTNRDGVAIDGYDPVAYFTIGEPTEGRSEFFHDWNGGRWYFSSEAHHDLFAAEPERYAPAYGGYCAWAVAEGNVAGINPQAWHIEDDRLYLNYSQRINRRFLGDLDGHLTRADEKWPGIQARLEAAAGSASSE
ncbi:MAG: YHS domain-containing (seleno)protein [Spirochaetaceae bacterium]